MDIVHVLLPGSTSHYDAYFARKHRATLSICYLRYDVQLKIVYLWVTERGTKRLLAHGLVGRSLGQSPEPTVACGWRMLAYRRHQRSLG